MKKIIMGVALLIIGAHMHGMEQEKTKDIIAGDDKRVNPRRALVERTDGLSSIGRTKKVASEDTPKFNESLQKKEEKK